MAFTDAEVRLLPPLGQQEWPSGNVNIPFVFAVSRSATLDGVTEDGLLSLSSLRACCSFGGRACLGVLLRSDSQDELILHYNYSLRSTTAEGWERMCTSSHVQLDVRECVDDPRGIAAANPTDGVDDPFNMAEAWTFRRLNSSGPETTRGTPPSSATPAPSMPAPSAPPWLTASVATLASIVCLALCMCGAVWCLRRYRRSLAPSGGAEAPKSQGDEGKVAHPSFVPEDRPASFTEFMFSASDWQSLQAYGKVDHWALKPENLQIDAPPEGSAGVGESGAVHSGWLLGANKVAVKVAGPEGRNALLHELRVVRRIRHPNIVLFQGAVVKELEVQLAFEWIAGCSFRKYVPQRRESGELAAQVLRLQRSSGPGQGRGLVHEHRLLLELAEALRYMHKQWVFHLAIRPASILVDLRREPPSTRLVDFSQAQLVDPKKLDEVRPRASGDADAFTAPEVSCGTTVGASADTFSFGAVALFALIAAEPPIEAGAAAARAVAFAGEERALRELGSLAAAQPVAVACLAEEPSQRPDFQVVHDRLAAKDVPGEANASELGWEGP